MHRLKTFAFKSLKRLSGSSLPHRKIKTRIVGLRYSLKLRQNTTRTLSLHTLIRRNHNILKLHSWLTYTRNRKSLKVRIYKRMWEGIKHRWKHRYDQSIENDPFEASQKGIRSSKAKGYYPTKQRKKTELCRSKDPKNGRNNTGLQTGYKLWTNVGTKREEKRNYLHSTTPAKARRWPESMKLTIWNFKKTMRGMREILREKVFYFFVHPSV